MRHGQAWPISFGGAVLALLLVLAGCGHPEPTAPAPESAPTQAPQVEHPSGPLPAQSATACTDGDSCEEQLPIGPGATLPVYRNFPLSGNPAITEAVVVVHGTGRNAGGYFERMLKAANLAGVGDRTLVAAPWFQTSDDDPRKGEARWDSGGWKIGDESLKPKGISSFAAMDQLVSRLADRTRFPNLTRITVAGHSAGGQFTQRYAATGKAPDTLHGIAVNFVVANPSSYLYPTPQRPDPTGKTMITPTGCSGYDEYKYGLAGRPPYLSGLSGEQILNNLTHRRVTYLLGGSDVEQDDELDTDCAARLQGQNRFQRGTFYFDWIHREYPTAPSDRIVVPGTAHEGDEMFQSVEARPVLFAPAAPTS